MELEAILGDLERVRRECSTQDWDGYNANPVSDKSYSSAMQFARLLPAEAPSPDICADPKGNIMFEWEKERGYVFSVIIGDRKLFYAGLFGTEKFHGKADFGEEIPNDILNSIKRFYD